MEPERKIEKLLRAYARKRRAEAGDALKLHPATRRMLQSEAKRRAPTAPEPEPGEGGILLLLLALFRRRLVLALCIVVVLGLAALMFLPALNTPERYAQKIAARNNLKEIGRAARQYASENKDLLPATLDEMTNRLMTEQELTDALSGKPFVYAGAGKRLDALQSNEVLAYSPTDKKGRQVLFADGRVETVTGARFAELTNQKPVEFALADKSARERVVETIPAAPPAAAPTSALLPPSPDRAKIALAKEEPKAADLGVKARSAGGPPVSQSELAEAEAKKLQPVPTPAPMGASAGSFAGVEQTTPMKGSISGKLPAIENSNALAQNQSFNRLTIQTNAGQLSFAASQNFVQAGVSGLQNYFKNSVASAQATPVLQSFQVQQNGDAISVVDEDGSVYHGSVQPETSAVRNQPASADTFAKPGALPQAEGKTSQVAENQQQQAAQNYFFRVAGMNRTLKQNVVFTGNVLANNALPQTPQTSNFLGAVGGGGGGGVGGQLQQVTANLPQQNLLSNSRIVGTAVIDRTNQIEINAVPVTQ